VSPAAGLNPQNLERLQALAARYPQRCSAVLPGLWLAQRQEGFVTPAAMADIASICGMSPSEVEATASFYTMLFTRAKGRHVVAICRAISCMLLGGDRLIEQVEHKLGCGHGETTADGAFTLLHAECLAACGGAPAMEVDWEFYEDLTPRRVEELLERFRESPEVAQPEGGGPLPAPARDKALAARARPKPTGRAVPQAEEA
jgi:NADH-quinone oxidoreductase E subunit